MYIGPEARLSQWTRLVLGCACRRLDARDRALLWRFRWALTGEKRALTRVLACVDWGDAAEARQAAVLTAAWTPVDIATALELLSPAFSNPEVCTDRRGPVWYLSSM